MLHGEMSDQQIDQLPVNLSSFNFKINSNKHVTLSGFADEMGEFIKGETEMADVLLIVAQEGYQPIEYGDTRAELENAGFGVNVASITTDKAVAGDGSSLTPDLAVRDAKAEDYDAIAVVGGPNAPELEKYPEVMDLIKRAFTLGKFVCSICISATILAKVGVLDGKKATVWATPASIQTLKNNGAEYIDEDVVRDGKIITADGPKSATKFGQAINDVLEKQSFSGTRKPKVFDALKES